MTGNPEIIEYLCLLQTHKSAQARPVRKFLEDHREDHVFVRRAKKLNELFELRKQLVQHDE